jgi:hypothetical protein
MIHRCPAAPVEIVEEFVDYPLYGFLEVEWLDESDG